MLTPECYAVGWIITAFSSTYQYATRSYLLDWFWERFVLWGWSQFYRLTLWLIQVSRVTLGLFRMSSSGPATISAFRYLDRYPEVGPCLLSRSSNLRNNSEEICKALFKPLPYHRSCFKPQPNSLIINDSDVYITIITKSSHSVS